MLILLQPGLHLFKMLLDTLFLPKLLFSLGFETSYCTATAPSAERKLVTLPASQPRCCVCVNVRVCVRVSTHTQLLCEPHFDYNIATRITFLSWRVILGSKCSNLLTCPPLPCTHRIKR